MMVGGLYREGREELKNGIINVDNKYLIQMSRGLRGRLIDGKSQAKKLN